MALINDKRIKDRQFFEAIDNRRRAYLAFDLANRAIPADDWAPDVSLLDTPIQVDFIPKPTGEAVTYYNDGSIAAVDFGLMRPWWDGTPGMNRER